MKTTMPSSSDDRTRAYAEAVVAGEIVAGPHVRNTCRRHLQDLEQAADRGLWFDREEAARAFRFFETRLKLSEGQFDGDAFQLHPSQAFIVGSIFGWRRKDGTRRFRRAYVEQGKGNGKSPMAGGIALFGLMADGEAGAQVYSAAAHKDQAAILFRDAVKMVRASPPLMKRIQFSGGIGREYNMAYHKTGSFFRPISKEAGKTGSGPRPHFALADEVHELPDGKILEMLERGFKFRRQPLLLMTTNSGTDRNSVCWQEHEWAVRVAAGNDEDKPDGGIKFLGKVLDDSTFSFICSIDVGDDPLNDPSCWPKANPLLGVTITEEYLAGVVAQAKNIPSKQNGILRLHFCVWTDSESAWMSREVVEPLLADFDPSEHRGASVSIGLDLSQNRDITAQGNVVRTGTTPDGKPTFDAWIEAWTPGDTMKERSERDKLPYPVWAQEGHIHAPPGENINYRHVAQTLAEYDRDYKIAMVAYDRYAFKRFEEDVKELGLSVNFVEHPQGGTKKGKPTQEMIDAAEREKKQAEGLWFPGSLRMLEDAMLEGRIRFRRNPVLISAIMSAVVEKDKWDNAWLSKQRSVNKIDAIVAIVMAFGAANALPVAKRKIHLFMVGGTNDVSGLHKSPA